LVAARAPPTGPTGPVSRRPPAHTELALRLTQQQQAGIGRLGAAVKIYCEFLAVDGW